MALPASGHAVVAGAGLAGLVAARILSEHFERVTVVERDRLPVSSEPRAGVPQGRHVHVLLPKGLRILEARFPGLADGLHSAGALRINVGRDLAWYHGGGWRTRHDSGLDLVAASRPLIEAQVAARVRDLPNVDVREATRVEAPLVETGRLIGVEIAASQGRATIAADLLVDASGRGSRMSRWLERLGFASPATVTVPAPLSYATCLFPRAGPGPEWRALMITAPASRRAGFCIAIEGDRWLVTLASFFDESSPRDRDDFRAFTRSLPVRDLHDAIGDLRPLSEVVQHRFPESLRRRYEYLRDHPTGLIAIGDAVCSFNPIYGQGMTVAALEAEALDPALTGAGPPGRGDAGFARRWYRRIGTIVDVAWQGVEIEDRRFPELAGERTTVLRAIQWYMTRVQTATHTDPAVTELFYRVIGFLDPPTALFHPRTVARVFKAGRVR